MRRGAEAYHMRNLTKLNRLTHSFQFVDLHLLKKLVVKNLINLFSLLLLFFLSSCGGSKNSTGKSNPLNGSWVPIKQEIGGKVLPGIAYSKQKLIINDSTYTLTAESVDKGVVRYKGDKMDIYGREGVNSGKHFTAKYKLENGLLNICYNLSGDSYPESFDTKGNPALFYCIFKRETY